MFNNPYEYNEKIINDAWRMAKIHLPDDSILRIHIVKRQNNLMNLDGAQFELKFDRGPLESKCRTYDNTINGMGDAFRIYSTAYEFAVDFCTKIKPQLFCWGTTNDTKAIRIYEALGKKFLKDRRYYPVELTKIKTSVGYKIIGIRKDNLEGDYVIF